MLVVGVGVGGNKKKFQRVSPSFNDFHRLDILLYVLSIVAPHKLAHAELPTKGSTK